MWGMPTNRTATIGIPSPLFISTAATVGGADFAQDYISRGWDFLYYKRHLHFKVLGTNSLHVELRYFLSYGLFQKGSEKYFPWEAPRDITRISQVDGIRLKVNRDLNWNWFKGANLFFTTGYRDFARWNTFRAELGFTPLSDLMGLPIVLWGQAGYNSSVTQYYRNAWSVGLAVTFEHIGEREWAELPCHSPEYQILAMTWGWRKSKPLHTCNTRCNMRVTAFKTRLDASIRLVTVMRNGRTK